MFFCIPLKSALCKKSLVIKFIFYVNKKTAQNTQLFFLVKYLIINSILPANIVLKCRTCSQVKPTISLHLSNFSLIIKCEHCYYFSFIINRLSVFSSFQSDLCCLPVSQQSNNIHLYGVILNSHNMSKRESTQ